MATPTPQITDLIDEMIELPDQHKLLCDAQMDDDSFKPGYLRLLLNREVLDLYRDIIDELEINRTIPEDAHPANINVADTVVVFLLQNDPEVRAARTDDEKLKIAKEKASGWYKKQKRQIENDALLIAMAGYNRLNTIPVPYKEGEIAFRAGEIEGRQRRLPNWMAGKENYEIPLPERRLDNIYERQLKQLNQLVDACGPLWALQFKQAYERGITKIIGMVEPKDDAGFPAKSSGKKVHAKSGAKSESAVDQA